MGDNGEGGDKNLIEGVTSSMDGPFLISFVWTIPRSKNVSVLFSDSEMTDCTSKIRIFLFVGPFPIHIWVLNVLADCNYGKTYQPC